jgi:hypothetical protein
LVPGVGGALFSLAWRAAQGQVLWERTARQKRSVERSSGVKPFFCLPLPSQDDEGPVIGRIQAASIASVDALKAFFGSDVPGEIRFLVQLCMLSAVGAGLFRVYQDFGELSPLVSFLLGSSMLILVLILAVGLPVLWMAAIFSSWVFVTVLIHPGPGHHVPPRFLAVSVCIAVVISTGVLVGILTALSEVPFLRDELRAW